MRRSRPAMRRTTQAMAGPTVRAMSVSYFKRFRMEIDLRGRRFDECELPGGYRLVAWRPDRLAAHAETKFHSFRHEIDADVFSCLADIDGCYRLMEEISHKDGFLAEATWLAAYEGERMVYATLVSSGLPQWQTAQGLFRIWLKVKLGKMSGREGYSDYYFLEDVPWSMYFYQSFALHGAYWHDKFGLRHSHGCVNLPPRDAKWLFDWVTPATSPYNFTLPTEEDPGAWVWVHG